MKSWSRDNGSGAAESAKTPTGVSNGSKALANYRLPVMFSAPANTTRQLGFKNDTFFLPAQQGSSGSALPDGEVRHHCRESRQTRLEALDLCQEPLT